jgi:hypothetical protein
MAGLGAKPKDVEDLAAGEGGAEMVEVVHIVWRKLKNLII